MAKDKIRIVVCGDSGVGKTSLIACLLKDQFIPWLQDVLSPITIPKDFSSSRYSPENTVVVDTSNSDLITLHKELKNADVIWLVYCDHESYERVALYWMMMFRSLGVNLPVVLCRNKCDDEVELLASANPVDSDDDQLDNKIEDEEFIPILREFKEVETCIKTSAKFKFNVNQAFYLCQRTITNPVAPLFDARIGELKPLGVLALKRVFMLSDADQDGYLSDDEIIQLQKKCFSKSIDINELQFLKDNLISISSPGQDYEEYTLYEPCLLYTSRCV